MEQHTCQKKVYRGNRDFMGGYCDKKAKIFENGKWLCGIHSSEANAKRKAKSDAKYAAHSQSIREQNQKYENRQKLLKAAEKWMDAQTMHNTSDLYNACVVYFGRTPVIPD